MRHLSIWQGPTAGPTYTREDVELAWRAEKDPLAVEEWLISHYDPPDNIFKPTLDFSPASYREQFEQAGKYQLPDPPDYQDLPTFNDEVPF